MRNLPQSLADKQRQEGGSDESDLYDGGLCPRGWPPLALNTTSSSKSEQTKPLTRTLSVKTPAKPSVSPSPSSRSMSSHGKVHQPHRTMSVRGYPVRYTASSPSSGENTSSYEGSLNEGIWTYLKEHRVRLVFSFISLIFLGIFFLVIYRRFSLPVFIATLSLVLGPAIFIIIYALRLKMGNHQKQSDDLTNANTLKNGLKTEERAVFTTQSLIKKGINNNGPNSPCTTIDMTPKGTGNVSGHHPNHKLERKTTQHKIKIQLPPSTIDDI